MAQDATDPSLGINAETGGTLTGWDHVVQSLRDIFLTFFGTRIMREWYGSFVPQALGRNITPAEVLPVIAALTSAIEQWEPRFVVVDAGIDATSARAGAIKIIIRGQFLPRALLGDRSPAGERKLTVDMGSDGMSVG